MGGGVDGHFRMIVFWSACQITFATTVLQELEKSVQLNGLPEKARTDQGVENIEM